MGLVNPEPFDMHEGNQAPAGHDRAGLIFDHHDAHRIRLELGPDRPERRMGQPRPFLGREQSGGHALAMFSKTISNEYTIAAAGFEA